MVGEAQATRRLALDELPELQLPRRLVLDVGSADGRWHRTPLKAGINLLGRAEDNDVVLEAHGVSRWHAELRVDPSGTALIRDAGSTNGTVLNGRALGEEVRRLYDGDELMLGDAVLRVRWEVL